MMFFRVSFCEHFSTERYSIEYCTAVESHSYKKILKCHSVESCYAECYASECLSAFPVLPSVILLNTAKCHYVTRN
jgi:hypothetical protein